MNINVDIGEERLPDGLRAQVGPRLTDSRPLSVASSDDGAEASEEEIWDEVDILYAQDDESVEQDESVMLVGTQIETLATPPLSPNVSPPRTHVLLPSEGAGGDGQSARTNPARESPSHRFFASPDQIDALRIPRSWVHGQVISTLGDTFCYPSRSKPRHEQYDVLPTNLFDLWKSCVGGHAKS